MKISLAITASILLLGIMLPAKANTTLDAAIQQTLEEHYQTYRDREYFSAIQSSVQVGNQPVKTYVVGTVSRDPQSDPITPQTLFNLGSITKSFTAVLLLQAETAGKIDLNQNFTDYLPQYALWPGISLTRLLNMTSAIPNYTDTPTLQYLISQDLSRFWTNAELVDFVYLPDVKPQPPLQSGYFYSNTAYILSGMILEKMYKIPFKELLENQILRPYNFQQTFYPIPDYTADQKVRLARGYNYNNYANPELTGRDVTDNNLSWAGPAGGVIGNTEDLVKWVRLLFVEDALLDASQKAKLTQVVSQSTGQPIARTTATDRRGFGLGIAQGHDADLGLYWFYEGETIGYRSLYVYVPCGQVIVTALVNSAVDESNDHLGPLVKRLYDVIKAHTPSLPTPDQCPSSR